MPLETVLALASFAFVMSISPGPGNFLLLASGLNYGFVRTVPLVLGISLGFLTMVLFVGLGLGEVLRHTPEIYIGLKLICAAYILWLAWKIARSRSLGDPDGKAMAKPIGFIQAALFQLVNPKAWAVALIVTVAYTNPDDYHLSLALLIGLFALVNLPSISVWALAGVALRRVLGEGDRIAYFNIGMALLLVASMLMILI